MDKVPKRIKFASIYRNLMNKYEDYLVFPLKNPAHYQIIGLLLSMGYLFLTSYTAKITLIMIILILDWYDGAAARKFHMTNKAGWMTDVTVDRLSEGFIIMTEIANPIGKILMLLFVFNVSLSFYSVRTGKHYVMPLRFFCVLLLLFRMI